MGLRLEVQTSQRQGWVGLSGDETGKQKLTDLGSFVLRVVLMMGVQFFCCCGSTFSDLIESHGCDQREGCITFCDSKIVIV